MRISEQLALAIEAQQLGLFGEPAPASPPPKPVEVPVPAVSAVPSLSMPEAKARVKELEKRQERVKKANAEYRKWLKKGMGPAEAVDRLTDGEAKKFAQRLLSVGALGKYPNENQVYSGFQTREIAKELANAKEQLRNLSREKNIPTMDEVVGEGWKFAEDMKGNQVVFSFEKVPGIRAISVLKDSHFIPDRTGKTWVRRADRSGRLSAERIIKSLQKMKG